MTKLHQLALVLVIIAAAAAVAAMICSEAGWAGNNSTLLNPTLLRDKKALCLRGNRASYYFVNGSGDGLTNWLVVLPVDGARTSRIAWTTVSIGAQPPAPIDLNNYDGIMSIHKRDNPDFYNWNRVVIRYCDGSSFTGNSKHFHHNKTLYFRGATIFNAAMKQLLHIGMGSATNALLAGESAGGVATMLHCDKFGDLFPSSTRVKCLSDAGYFFPAKRHNYGTQSHFLSIFQGLIRLHRSRKALPTSCTHKMSPALCFFAQNVGKYIKTPLFFLVSQFDFIETSYTTGLPKSYYEVCVTAKNCSSTQIKIMQVCLRGNRASYYFVNGSGDGLTTWLVVLPGGGWCDNFTYCLDYGVNRSTSPAPFDLNNYSGIMSNHKLDNPDFYNWNKVIIRYCDGSSFNSPVTPNIFTIVFWFDFYLKNKTLHFRGATIFNAAMKELLHMGMGSATNALLAGESAGGVATMLHCDKFRDLFPSSTRVKCLSDAGYFFPAKRHNYGIQSYFVSIFQGLIRLHTSYTTGLSQCYYSGCVNAKNCSSTQIKIMQDLRMELLDVLPKQRNASQNGFLILSNPAHTHILEITWHDGANSGTQETIAKQFGDWYFREKKVQFIQDCAHPYGCRGKYYQLLN